MHKRPYAISRNRYTQTHTLNVLVWNGILRECVIDVGARSRQYQCGWQVENENVLKCYKLMMMEEKEMDCEQRELSYR